MLENRLAKYAGVTSFDELHDCSATCQQIFRVNIHNVALHLNEKHQNQIKKIHHTKKIPSLKGVLYQLELWGHSPSFPLDARYYVSLFAMPYPRS